MNAVAVDDLAIYVTSSQGIVRFDKAGGSPQVLAPESGADSIAIDAGYVYAKILAGDATESIVRVPKAGGAVSEAWSGPDGYHYSSQELAVDATSVYWVDPQAGVLQKAPIAGGAAVVIAGGLADPVSLTLDGGMVYFTVRGKDGGSLDDRAVARVPVGGGPLGYVAHGPQTSAYGIAVDAVYAYWTEQVVDGPANAACK